jgi:histone deacetylase complex regulatory component SIN3
MGAIEPPHAWPLAIYNQFITLLVDYHKDRGREKVTELCIRIQALLVNDPDLMEGFRKFLPAFVPEGRVRVKVED